MYTYNIAKNLSEILNIEFEQNPDISDQSLDQIPDDAKLTSTRYSILGTQCSILVRKGVPLTEEHRKKISEAQKGIPRPEMSKRMICNSINKGRVFSAETRNNMSKSKIGNKNRLGKAHSEEMKRVISERTSLALRGKIQSKVACPHCNTIGGISNMRRYHFEHCKQSINPHHS